MNMATAPKERPILLYVPSFGLFLSSWWVGAWSWSQNAWTIRTPFAMGSKSIYISEIPQPIEWEELPRPPEFSETFTEYHETSG